MVVWSWGVAGPRGRAGAARVGRCRCSAGLALVAVYPVAGTYARKGGFSESPTPERAAWLEAAAPGDPPAIDWLREHAPRDAVVLEAVGDDYSAFGHARISTFTGPADRDGLAGHELQWGHDPGTPPRRTSSASTDARRGGRAPLLDALRRALRRRRAARARRLRRRRAGEVGPARAPRLRPRRHDGVGAALIELGDAPAAWAALGFAADAAGEVVLGEASGCG